MDTINLWSPCALRVTTSGRSFSVTNVSPTDGKLKVVTAPTRRSRRVTVKTPVKGRTVGSGSVESLEEMVGPLVSVSKL